MTASLLDVSPVSQQTPHNTPQARQAKQLSIDSGSFAFHLPPELWPKIASNTAIQKESADHEKKLRLVCKALYAAFPIVNTAVKTIRYIPATQPTSLTPNDIDWSPEHSMTYLPTTPSKQDFKIMAKHVGGLLDRLPNLVSLNISFCDELKFLPDAIAKLSQLQCLKLDWLDNLEALPDGLVGLSKLEVLFATNCNELKKLPENFGVDCKLRILNVSWCQKLRALPQSLAQVTTLQTLAIAFCAELPNETIPTALTERQGLEIIDNPDKLEAIQFIA